MKMEEWLREHRDPGNICMPEMSVSEALSILCDELLDGEKRYISYSCTEGQALAEVVNAVVQRGWKWNAMLLHMRQVGKGSRWLAVPKKILGKKSNPEVEHGKGS